MREREHSMAKKCEYCGTPYVSGANFCQSCGAPRYAASETAQSAENTAQQTEAAETRTTVSRTEETGAGTDSILDSLFSGKTAAIGGSLLGALLLGGTIRRNRSRRRAMNPVPTMQTPPAPMPHQARGSMGRAHGGRRPVPPGHRQGMHGQSGGMRGRPGKRF